MYTGVSPTIRVAMVNVGPDTLQLIAQKSLLCVKSSTHSVMHLYAESNSNARLQGSAMGMAWLEH